MNNIEIEIPVEGQQTEGVQEFELEVAPFANSNTIMTPIGNNFRGRVVWTRNGQNTQHGRIRVDFQLQLERTIAGNVSFGTNVRWVTVTITSNSALTADGALAVNRHASQSFSGNVVSGVANIGGIHTRWFPATTAPTFTFAAGIYTYGPTLSGHFSSATTNPANRTVNSFTNSINRNGFAIRRGSTVINRARS